MSRPDLMALLGGRVTVISTTSPSRWTGTLVAVCNDPSLVIEEDHGERMTLPQSFTVVPLDEKSAPAACREIGAASGYLVGARVHGQPDDLVAKLDGMLANLQAHIDQRAAELAQPLIAKAREAAVTNVERAQREQQRAEDLVAELRRQLAVRERYNQSYQGRAAAIRAMHPEHEGRCVRCVQWCDCMDQARANDPELKGLEDLGLRWTECPHGNEPYPCPTIRALDGTTDQQEAGRG